MGNMMSLNIDKSMVEPVIREHVKALMIEALGGSDAIIDKVIATVLQTKVDEQGRPCTYSSAKSLFEWMLQDEIKKIVRELIKEEVQSCSSKIKEKIKENLQSKKGSDKFSAAIMNAFSESIANDWRTTFNVSIETPRNNDY